MTKKDRERIERAIGDAEKGTTGLIIVRVLNDRRLDPMARAKAEFAHFGLHRRDERNAAVLLVAPNARQFALYGDRALHERVGDAFWTEVTSEFKRYLTYDQLVDGIVALVGRLGAAYREHFPDAATP